ncbi:30S ribosomal protein S17 [bacterium (Candidatus Moisslbacteria) CG12_big_fil_rev_8_21_14_0_65_36_11]|nr:30S ribosomal protein S17 [Candidatus Kuenenbacteria bacterium]OIP76365.1 MAG: 30S ribosomal protein S17 [Parcubacteria group bacterium CG2_30_36_38]PIV45996.1 MAG: 30S ribosomal protein S17 [bacterium (Candidatus Moisslbacteria) CG02_land_8_20_14_3_00_36_53]PIW68134.1 MAG: 30S ribosomal protein S17 [bacterium (Candidatus Moisslbacteria) CG12_big_fil_rev_8_21_14_0_65_36_11]PIZ90469.1 MAG: 30S ribosomal protein S17 [bacterium (Candidatus Moisslbacteria) CG_4_10_14_0_2_um_filter_36_61]PJC0089
MKINKQILQGVVISDKMQKTVVAEVKRQKEHPLYRKKYWVSKKYKVHDPKGEAKVGNMIKFISCRPMSREKKFRLIEIIS